MAACPRRRPTRARIRVASGSGTSTGGESGRRWPVFALAARQAGAAAIFAFPLQIGAIRAGVLGLYRERPGPLTAFQLGDALIFADTATLLLLDAHAYARDLRLTDVARDIVARRLRLHPDPSRDGEA